MTDLGLANEPPSSPAPAFRKGTLTYTKCGLVLLFFYLLWGDFCLQLMEMVIPLVLPLQLRQWGGSNLTMSLLITTTPFAFNLLVNPVVSFRSDNLRTRWGRRRPFLLVAAPMVTVFLVLMAFAPEIGRGLFRTLAGPGLAASGATAVIVTMAGLLLLFQLFNTCMNPIYGYLCIDVVPDRYLARFLSLFRIVAMLSGYLFNRFIYGHALDYTRSIYLGAALLYFTGFMAMCLLVRESDYPPPVHDRRLGLAGSVRVYCRECFSHRHYLLFNARNGAMALSGLCGMYIVFFLRDSLGIPLPFIGKVASWSHLIAAALLFPMGMLSDRFNPVRTMLAAMLLFFPIHALNYLFLQGPSSYVVLVLLHLTLSSLINASELPMYAMVLPRERYGQFASANQILTSVVVIVGSLAAGRFMDWVTVKGTLAANYRYLYLWAFGFQCLAVIFMLLFYRSWRTHGGPYRYQPPNA